MSATASVSAEVTAQSYLFSARRKDFFFQESAVAMSRISEVRQGLKEIFFLGNLLCGSLPRQPL